MNRCWSIRDSGSCGADTPVRQRAAVPLPVSSPGEAACYETSMPRPSGRTNYLSSREAAVWESQARQCREGKSGRSRVRFSGRHQFRNGLVSPGRFGIETESRRAAENTSMFEVSGGHIEESRFANSLTTTVNTLRPEFRYAVVFLWTFAGAVLAWVALTGIARSGSVFFGAGALVGLAVLVIWLRREAALARNHLIASATVISHRRRRRATVLTYRFIALDGKSYEGETSVSSQQKTLPEALTVLYNPLDPATSEPENGFIFYRFKSN